MCLRGASAVERILSDFPGKPIRAIVVWEPVLLTDWAAPSSATLDRVSDKRAEQFWDRKRLLSHLLGEHDRRSIVWDHIAVYPAGVSWDERPPQPLFQDGPVVRVTAPARAAVEKALMAAVP